MSRVLRIAAKRRFTYFYLRLIVLILIVAVHCLAGNVVVLIGRSSNLDEAEPIKKIVGFYGLGLETIDLSAGSAFRETTRKLSDAQTLAVFVSEDALSQLEYARVFEALRRSGTRGVPLMVFGIRSEAPTREIMLWSKDSLTGCAPLPAEFRPQVVAVENVKDVTDSLAGWDIPAVSSPSCDLQVNPGRGATVLLTSRQPNSTATELVRARVGPSEVFFLPALKQFNSHWIGQPNRVPEAFSAFAPFLMFVRWAAGEYGWHLDAHYANLTIDDAWLTEPYGHLNYRGLLAEMQKHNFHTTIAFIPWNYGRSKPDVAALFRKSPERFSVSIHGNNHAHREFEQYSQVPLSHQIEDIKQGLARMERFQALTGVRYDRFMVFPHSVAPSDTFASLKGYNFLGTANSQNVPLGTPYPTDATFVLRPYAIDFGNFLSILRYSAEGTVPRLAIAIEGFLDNPLLFYGHERLFDQGIDAFDGIADFVNRVQPETRWASLGEIARHLYMIQRRDEVSFNVRMFSNEITLENPTQRYATFYIQKPEDFSLPIRSLKVEGVSRPYERAGDLLSFRLAIPAGQSRSVQITYQNDLDFAHLDVRHTSLYATVLRMLSDFRDLYLSRFSAGRALTRVYYTYELDSIELGIERNRYLIVACAGVLITAYWRLRRRKRRTGRRIFAG